MWALVTGLASILGLALAWFLTPPDRQVGFLSWLSSPVVWLFGLPLWLPVAAGACVVGLAAAILWRSQSRGTAKATRRLLVRYDYQHADSSVAVSVLNNGSLPVEWFTIEIGSADGSTFDVGHASSVAGLKASGLGGSFTTISGERLLPGQHGCVMLSPAMGVAIKLKEPIVKTDAQSVFAGEIHMTWGPEESLEPGASAEHI